MAALATKRLLVANLDFAIVGMCPGVTKMMRLLRAYLITREKRAKKGEKKEKKKKFTKGRKAMMKGFLVMELVPSIPKEPPQNPFAFAKPGVPIGAVDHSIDDVQDGSLVSAAACVGVEQIFPGWASVLRNTGTPVPADITKMKSLWLHIGYCNFKTMIWSGLHLLRQGSKHDAEGQELEVELSLPNPVTCYRCFEFLHKHVDFPKAYTLKLWALETKGAHLSKAKMAPKQVLVRAFPHIPAVQVWKGSYLEAKEEEERKKIVEGKEQKTRAKLAAPNHKLGEFLHSKKKRKQSTDSAELIVDDTDHAGVASHDSHESNLHDDQDQDKSSDSSSSSASESDTDSDDEDHGNEVPSDDSSSSGDDSADDDLCGYSDYAPDTEDDAEVTDKDTSLAVEAAPASSSSGAVAPEPASGSGLHREKATCITIPGYGELRYHEKTQNIVAFCHTHKATCDCRRSRTVCENSSRAGQGRPIGLLVAWLLDPASHDGDGAKRFVHPFEARLAARRHFNALDGSTEFAQCERRRHETETDDEPRKIL